MIKDGHVLPFLWYSGEGISAVEDEIRAIKSCGVDEFVLENRGGNWFCTDFWWTLMDRVFLLAQQLGMRVWMLDDAHVGSGNANDSLFKPENDAYRVQNIRCDCMDVVGPCDGDCALLPEHTASETLLQIAAAPHDPAKNRCGDPVAIGLENVHDGLCELNLPAGNWRVFFVFTVDHDKCGIFSHYIAMTSQAACRHLLNEVHEKLYAHFPQYFGNVFAGFFTDEPAFGNCTGEYNQAMFQLRMGGDLQSFFPWAEDMAERLAAQCRCTPDEARLKLPMLWQELGDGTDDFRHQYMDLVTKLWRDNFSRQIGDWCRDHHVEFIGHIIEDAGVHTRTAWGAGHYFRAMEGQDMAGIDIVLGQMIPGVTCLPHRVDSSWTIVSSKFYQYTLAKLGASLAHAMPHMRNRVVCETFGAYGWNAGLSTMRYVFNHFLSNGTNHFIPHAFSPTVPSVFRSSEVTKRDAGPSVPPGYAAGYLAPTYFCGGFNPQFRHFGKLMRYVREICEKISDGVHQADVAILYPAELEWNTRKCFCIDEIAATLTRNGIDFDFLPLDILHSEKTTLANGQIHVNQESYGALLMPESAYYPPEVPALVSALEQAGVPVLRVGEEPFAQENPGKAVSLSALVPELRERNLARLAARPGWPAEVRSYALRKADGAMLYLFFNEGTTPAEAEIILPQQPDWSKTYLHDVWHSVKSRPEHTADGFRLKLDAQQMLLLSIGEEDASALPLFDYDFHAEKEVEVLCDISARSVLEKEFRPLLSRSKAVNLMRLPGMTRFCGEICYEGVFDCADASAKCLEIPGASDCLELWLNGEACGVELGPVCKFDVRGKVKPGRNTLKILCYGNPAYADRQEDGTAAHGYTMKFLRHGFTGAVCLE